MPVIGGSEVGRDRVDVSDVGRGRVKGQRFRDGQRPPSVDRIPDICENITFPCTMYLVGKKRLFFAVECPARRLRSGGGSLLKFPRTPVGEMGVSMEVCVSGKLIAAFKYNHNELSYLYHLPNKRK